MPCYPFECECGKKQDVFAHLSETVANPLCECGKTMRRDWGASKIGSRNQEYQKPVEMMSVAANSMEEIRQIQRECPDVKISTDRRDPLFGVPIAASRAQKLAVLKAVGYVEKN